MKPPLLTAVVLAITSAGCATPEGKARRADTCIAGPGQAFVGKRVAATGVRLLKATRTAELRWVPPRSIVTTEYKYGRVTVDLDEDRTITRVACG